MHGATALVLALKRGQEMMVEAVKSFSSPSINWKAMESGKPWFSAVFSVDGMRALTCSDKETANKLARVLTAVQKLNPDVFVHGLDYHMVTNTAFNNHWGWGSSSSLIANLAKFARVDPYRLYFSASSGSGADVAGALARGPVQYKLNSSKPYYAAVDFNPPFKDKIWFVYRGNKQDSHKSVMNFRRNGFDHALVQSVDNITHDMICTGSLKHFMELIDEHEKILASVLDEIPVRSALFNDFPGSIKSLGAWGGDFIMAVSEADDSVVNTYFSNRGLSPVFRFDEIVLG